MRCARASVVVLGNRRRINDSRRLVCGLIQRKNGLESCVRVLSKSDSFGLDGLRERIAHRQLAVAIVADEALPDGNVAWKILLDEVDIPALEKVAALAKCLLHCALPRTIQYVE